MNTLSFSIVFQANHENQWWFGTDSISSFRIFIDNGVMTILDVSVKANERAQQQHVLEALTQHDQAILGVNFRKDVRQIFGELTDWNQRCASLGYIFGAHKGRCQSSRFYCTVCAIDRFMICF